MDACCVSVWVYAFAYTFLCFFFHSVFFLHGNHQSTAAAWALSTKLNKKWPNKTKRTNGKIRRRTFKCTSEYDKKGETEVTSNDTCKKSMGWTMAIAVRSNRKKTKTKLYVRSAHRKHKLWMFGFASYSILSNICDQRTEQIKFAVCDTITTDRSTSQQWS